MARTLRRKREFHEYCRVLRYADKQYAYGRWLSIDAFTPAGIRALALFHSDKKVLMSKSAPRCFRKASDNRMDTRNNRMMRRWLVDPAFDPVFQAWHKHDANRDWW